MFIKLGKKFIASPTFKSLWSKIIGNDNKKLNLKDNKKRKGLC